MFLLIAVFTSIAAFAVHDLKSLYLTAAIGIICIYFSIKAYKINKKISAATADLSFGEMDITVNEVKAMLCETEKIIKEYNCDLERIYSENDVTDFDELTEKYYAKKAEYERSDSQALKISATESSKKFISHVNECCKSETFEEAKENFEALKSLAMNTNSLKKEYNNLLEATENTDRTIQEYEALINEFSADTNIIATDEKAAAERRISILTEKMLNIKGSYPKECKSVYELKHSEQNAEAELSKLNETYSALLMAEEVLKETYNEISHGFIPKVNKTASEFLSELESNKNSEMIITDNVIPKVKKDSAGDFIHSGYMSESEKERIYLALRLAIISAIETDNKLPIIADDIFSSYDNDLKEQAIKFLISFSKNRQVIFFTCHENEKNIFGDTHRKLTL